MDDYDIEDFIKDLTDMYYKKGRFDGMVTVILSVTIGLIVGYLARYFFHLSVIHP
jgi:hypothetical protein